MNKQLSPGEIHVGQIVTVLENKPYSHQSEGLYGDVQTMATTDRSGMADVHTVTAIDLPYVVLRREQSGSLAGITYPIDTRRTILMELSMEYAMALHPHLAEKGGVK